MGTMELIDSQVALGEQATYGAVQEPLSSNHISM